MLITWSVRSCCRRSSCLLLLLLLLLTVGEAVVSSWTTLARLGEHVAGLLGVGVTLGLLLLLLLLLGITTIAHHRGELSVAHLVLILQHCFLSQLLGEVILTLLAHTRGSWRSSATHTRGALRSLRSHSRVTLLRTLLGVEAMVGPHHSGVSPGAHHTRVPAGAMGMHPGWHGRVKTGKPATRRIPSHTRGSIGGVPHHWPGTRRQAHAGMVGMVLIPVGWHHSLLVRQKVSLMLLRGLRSLKVAIK